MKDLPDSAPSDHSADDQSPGVPGFRTWRGVYGFVLATFAAVVALLAVFTHAYR